MLKKLLFLFMILLMLPSAFLLAQSSLPSKELRDLKGNSVNSKEIFKGGGPYIVSFWATWCKPCLKELNAIAEFYPDWQKETGVKLVAISIDDARAAHKVPSFVNGQAWDYEVYIDENGDFKRAMNVINIPHTFVLNKQGKVVYQQTIYAPGDEEKLYDKLKSMKNAE